MKKLSGKTAVITGAGRGIGRATAALFARQGANLILISRTESQLRETESLCMGLNPEISILCAAIDVKDVLSIENLFKNLESPLNSIDILINNAAIFLKSHLDKLPLKDFLVLLETNLVAPFFLSQQAIARMPESGGTIVNISSLSGCPGYQKFPGFGAYGISKYGLWGLTEMLALENTHRKIRVNQISLSGVDTAMFVAAAPPGLKPQLTPENVAEKILYLASDDSFPMTGENLIYATPETISK